jgi:phosphoribosylformimino-5-aminoimidazole carboxamide ribotide isomerase
MNLSLRPAIDLLGGQAVRLHQGSYDAVTVYDADPIARARSFRAHTNRLHVVDLEGAKAGAPVQRDLVRAIIEAFEGDVQVGGGVRDAASFDAYLALGATRIVLGSAAVKSRGLVESLARANPGVVVVALDAKDGLVAIDGWTTVSKLRALDFAAELASLPLGAVLYTDIARDGTHVGPNVAATVALQAAVPFPVIASGGIGSLDDVRAIAAAGLREAVVGRALYDGRFTLDEALVAARGGATR